MSRLKERYAREDTWWRRWGAVIVLVVFFFASWGGQLLTQMEVVRQEAEQHGQEFSISEFWPQFFSSTFENWQSEWLQLVTQALLIAAFADYFFRKGNQDHYQTQLMIEELRDEIKKNK